jgi:hypothetical protein
MKSRRFRWVGHVACMRMDRKVYKVLVGNPERKSPLGKDQGIDGMGSEYILGRLFGMGGADSVVSG